MQHPVEASGHDLGQMGAVEQVDFDEGGPGRHGPVVALGEVVGHGHLVPGVEELGGYDAADVAGPTGDEKSHAPHAIGVQTEVPTNPGVMPEKWSGFAAGEAVKPLGLSPASGEAAAIRGFRAFGVR